MRARRLLVLSFSTGDRSTPETDIRCRTGAGYEPPSTLASPRTPAPQPPNSKASLWTLAVVERKGNFHRTWPDLGIFAGSGPLRTPGCSGIAGREPFHDALRLPPVPERMVGGLGP